jgi:hypothetical protein
MSLSPSLCAHKLALFEAGFFSLMYYLFDEWIEWNVGFSSIQMVSSDPALKIVLRC